MPPKRKPKQDSVSNSDESDVVSPPRPTATTVLPEVMRNIELLKMKRDRDRKKIAAGFDAYITGLKNEIADRYDSEAKKRETGTKALLKRYVEALEKRASIEKSIESIVLDSGEDLKGLAIILEAAYSGRQKQFAAAKGSFASIEPAQTTSVGASAHLGATTQSSSVAQGDPWLSKGEKADYAHNNRSEDVRNTKHGDRERGRDDVFAQILW
ncbi:hypothetical protein F4777DRAFT_235341 [Nemania sp. FL0916]|nr:hypothetical protein F4777DRAFT_235341 [Nemania sp. FL0916]